MTNTTTALQELIEAADRIKIYVQGEATEAELDEFFHVLEAARAALSAQAAAQDAPAYLQGLIDRLLMPPPSMTGGQAQELHREAAEMLHLMGRAARAAQDAPAGMAEFRKGVRAMFDHLTYRAANHWHGDPVTEAECKKERDLINSWAAEALHEVSPEDAMEWSRIIELQQEIDKLRAARASQPATPAQDAKAKVPVEWVEKVFVQIEEAATDPSVACYEGRGLWDNAKVSENWSACQNALERVRYAIDERRGQLDDIVTPPAAHQVAGQGQAVCYLSSKQLRGIPAGELRGHYIPFSLEREGNFDTPVNLAAPTAPQAPALVPISVDDELPPKNQEVFICFAGQNTLWSTGQYTGSAMDVNGWCYPAENRGMTDDGSDPVVTHWLPMFDVPGITPTTKEQQA